MPGLASASGGIDGGTRTSASYGEDSARTYDPYWFNALALLDHLNERGMIKTSIFGAALGEIVLCNGPAWLIDTTDVHRLYDRPQFREAAQGKLAQTIGENFSWNDADIDYEVVANMAPQVQFQLTSGLIYNIWSTLRPDGLVTPPTELAAKHGVNLEGDWHVLGIKDANPDTEKAEDKIRRIDALKKLNEGRPYMHDAINACFAAKTMFGRPPSCYGMTPLLIFRKIV